MKFILPVLFIVLLSCNASKNSKSNRLPACLLKKIDDMKGSKHDSPESVTSYEYKGQVVFYLRMPCCDQFNEVYDGDCNYLGSPDGGLQGKGDKKLADFFTEAKNKKTVWEQK